MILIDFWLVWLMIVFIWLILIYQLAVITYTYTLKKGEGIYAKGARFYVGWLGGVLATHLAYIRNSINS